MTASTVEQAAVQETLPSPLLFLDEESLPSLEEASCALENRIMAARLILYLYALAWRPKAELEREGEGWAAENASHRPVYFDGEMIDEHIARADQTVQLVYLTDWRNSVMGVLPVNQPTVVDHYAYALNGGFREKTEQVAQRYGFTGREFGEIHGLMQYRARWMNPSWGRFSQRDPLRGFVASGLRHDYVYAENGPIIATDADGKISVIVGVLLGAGLFAIGASTVYLGAYWWFGGFDEIPASTLWEPFPSVLCPWDRKAIEARIKEIDEFEKSGGNAPGFVPSYGTSPWPLNRTHDAYTIPWPGGKVPENDFVKHGMYHHETVHHKQVHDLQRKYNNDFSDMRDDWVRNDWPNEREAYEFEKQDLRDVLKRR